MCAAGRSPAITHRPGSKSRAAGGFDVGAGALIGRRLGAYEIVALIGSGGMGEVYRARRIDAQYEKEVAIKLVPSALPASFILKRLRAERQILARLDHPHIAQLIDGGATEEGLPTS